MFYRDPPKTAASGSFIDKVRLLVRHDDLLTSLLLVTLCIFAIVTWGSTIWTIIKDYNPLPVWDYWQIPEHLERYKAFDLAVLWSQHNEHRIVFPEIVFAIDILLFRGRQLFPLAISFICYLGVWVVLGWAFNTDKQISRPIRQMGILLAGIIIGWQGCSVVLGNTFLLQWTMLQLAVALSLMLLAMPRAHVSSFYFGASILSAIIATYSSGNGMFIWPILLIAAGVTKLPKIRILILGVAGAVSIWVFFIGYHSSRDLKLLTVAKHPLYFIGFLASYLSMPVGGFGRPGWGIRWGLANVLVFVFLVLVASRTRIVKSVPSVVLFGMFAFAAASGALTALGRMNPDDPLFIAPKAARYVTLPLGNWATLILCLIWVAARTNWRRPPLTLIGVVISLGLLWISYRLQPWLRWNGAFIADQQVATLSVENGLLDPEFGRKLYPDPRMISRMLPVLSSHKLAIYSNPSDMSLLGKSVGAVPRNCDDRTDRVASTIYPVVGGFELVGSWPGESSASRVIFLSDQSIVTGFGEEILAGVPSVAAGLPSTGAKRWIGFIDSRFGGKSFSTVSVDGDGRPLCRLEQPRALGNTQLIVSTEIGRPISDVTWKGTGWKRDLLPPHVDEKNPSAPFFWSSWNGTDASSGQLESSDVTVPPNHCLILSTLHGPSIGGLMVQLIDGKTSRRLEIIPMNSGEEGWKFWRIPLSPESPVVQIIAEDKGTDWGQWVAIASPWECE